MSVVLGLDLNDHNTSAAIVVDGVVRAAAHEERFNREKRTRRFPLSAMNFCLASAGATLREVDAVAVSVNPAIYLESLNTANSERARYRGELLYAPVNYLLGLTPGVDSTSARLSVAAEPLGGLDLHYVRHHDCHAAASFLTSPFDAAAVLSVDAFGEKETTVLYAGEGNALRRLHSVEFPHSVGCFYAVLTEFLGLRPDRDEWKLMAAAAHGSARRFIGAMRELIRCAEGGRVEMDLAAFSHYLFHRPGLFSPRLVERLGPAYGPGAEPDERFFDIAAATQAVTEEVVFGLLRHLATLVPSRDLCLGGGVALNCVLNGKITANTPFRRVFVPPMPDDSGTSVGAALSVAATAFDAPRAASMVRNDWGPSFDDDAIEAELTRAKARFERVSSPAAEAAGALAAHRLVGWFQGGMEFGDRALGHRSILADPRDASAPSRIAAEIKARRSYQPFAPSVLAERAGEWFVDAAPSPFMEKTFRVRTEHAASIPAVLGPDGAARVQTVTAEQNELFHRLIATFEAVTGVPAVLNTSFNEDGEPIVATPRDALRTYFATGLDDLFIGSFRVRKDPR